MVYRPVLVLSIMLICMSSFAHCHSPPDATDLSNTISSLPPLTLIRVRGKLLCTIPPPSPPKYPPLFPGLNGLYVAFTCDGGKSTTTDAVTDKNGVFEFTLKATDTLMAILFGPSQSGECSIIARLDAASCGVLPPTGILRAPIIPENTYTETLHGRHYVVHQCNVGRFSSYPPPN